MAPNTRLYTVALNAALDAVGITALLAGGQIQIYTGAQPAVQGALTGTKLSTLTFGSPALGAASGGVATANAITQDSSATGSVGTSGANMNLATLSINAGDVVTCSSLTLTIPAQGA